MAKDKKHSHGVFEQFVSEGIDALPDTVLSKLSNVAIVVEDEPTDRHREETRLADNETLFGLYEGVPQTERGSAYSALPDKITIFKHPIERRARTEDEIRSIVTTTVWHEVAHHFGMEEDEVRMEERRRGYEVE